MSRIALVHLSGPPAVGGIEDLLVAQTKTLSAHGFAVEVVTGNEATVGGAETICLPLMDPASRAVIEAVVKVAHDTSLDDHPLTRALETELHTIFSSCAQVWVHNAFTVELNPFLTSALRHLVKAMRGVRWVAWCEDITATSKYRSSAPPEPWAWPVGRLQCTTISKSRKNELASYFGIDPVGIRVIQPPLLSESWLDIGPEARRLQHELRLLVSDVLVVVPAKLLPHKNLESAVHLATELRTRVRNPQVLVTAAPSPHEPELSGAVGKGLRRLAGDLGVSDHMHLASEVLDATLSRRAVRDLMMLSDCVFLPSSEEGFGMPLLEAASLRVPVVCNDTPVFREVAGPSAVYITPGDVSGAATAVMGLLRTPTNEFRRYTLGSWGRFERDTLLLANAGNR